MTEDVGLTRAAANGNSLSLGAVSDLDQSTGSPVAVSVGIGVRFHEIEVESTGIRRAIVEGEIQLGACGAIPTGCDIQQSGSGTAGILNRTADDHVVSGHQIQHIG